MKKTLVKVIEDNLQDAQDYYDRSKPLYSTWVEYEEFILNAYRKLEVCVVEAIRLLLLSKGIRTVKIRDYRRLDTKEKLKKISKKLIELRDRDERLKKIVRDYHTLLCHFGWVEDFSLETLKERIDETKRLLRKIEKVI